MVCTAKGQQRHVGFTGVTEYPRGSVDDSGGVQESFRNRMRFFDPASATALSRSSHVVQNCLYSASTGDQ